MFPETLDALRPGRSAGLARPEPVTVPVPGELGHLHQSHLPGCARAARHIGAAHPEGPERGLLAPVRLQRFGQLPIDLFAGPVVRRRHVRWYVCWHVRWYVRRHVRQHGRRLQHSTAAPHQAIPIAYRVYFNRVRLGQGAQRTAHLKRTKNEKRYKIYSVYRGATTCFKKRLRPCKKRRKFRRGTSCIIITGVWNIPFLKVTRFNCFTKTN